MEQTSRRFSRVKTRLKIRFRPTYADAMPLFLGCVDCSSKPDLSSVKSNYLPQELLDFLSHMDNKLDLILSFFSQKDVEQDYPGAGEIIEISGAGLRFSTDQKIEPGEYLEAAIFLSSLPPVVIGVVGKIIRKEELHNKAVYAFEYVNIRESDREQIVQFVFKEQRELLREQRL
ncbi:MAG: PilZ domain-containing protein [Desulfonauticus sp.]|nr:PilZ domain-containing protein [Desulfonauticus sp.]